MIFATNSNAFSYRYCTYATPYTAEYLILIFIVNYFLEANIFHADWYSGTISREFFPRLFTKKSVLFSMGN